MKNLDEGPPRPNAGNTVGNTVGNTLCMTALCSVRCPIGSPSRACMPTFQSHVDAGVVEQDIDMDKGGASLFALTSRVSFFMDSTREPH
jgi:hypothetical protein